MAPNAIFSSVPDAVAAILANAPDRAVNVRSYLPDDPRGRKFIYGLTNTKEAVSHLEQLGAEGLHLIVNETVDVCDGGVSGVIHGDLIEFAPDDTPRCVEKPGTAALPRQMGLAILKTVYGFHAEIPQRPGDRIEFSIHPKRRGWRSTNTLLWEIESDVEAGASVPPTWPNRFSRHIGDKVFGLLVADALGSPVPYTIAIGRRVAPFIFGQKTGSGESWIRTCPRDPQPGLYTTAKGWRDPFDLLSEEDSDGQIASVLSQDGIPAAWSGAAIIGAEGRLIVEGKEDEGDMFMLGHAKPEPLPQDVASAVTKIHQNLSADLGPVRIEWVHDGVGVWIVQLHVGATGTEGRVLVQGRAQKWVYFEASRGLTELRSFLETIPDNSGLILKGEVGLTSHIADLVRKWNRPAKMARQLKSA
jgi:hypothetical protein